jgi:acyl-CoA dehydrogenase
MIYEGANGIQALDLVGRKLGRNGGRAVLAFFGEVESFLKDHADDAGMLPYSEPLGEALGHLRGATMWLMQNAADPESAGAAATDFMHLFGLVALGYMWCRIVAAAHVRLAAGADGSSARLNAKLAVGRFFMERMLPETTAHLKRIRSGARTAMELPAEAF